MELKKAFFAFAFLIINPGFAVDHASIDLPSQSETTSSDGFVPRQGDPCSGLSSGERNIVNLLDQKLTENQTKLKSGLFNEAQLNNEMNLAFKLYARSPDMKKRIQSALYAKVINRQAQLSLSAVKEGLNQKNESVSMPGFDEYRTSVKAYSDALTQIAKDTGDNSDGSLANKIKGTAKGYGGATFLSGKRTHMGFIAQPNLGLLRQQAINRSKSLIALLEGSSVQDLGSHPEAGKAVSRGYGGANKSALSLLENDLANLNDANENRWKMIELSTKISLVAASLPASFAADTMVAAGALGGVGFGGGLSLAQTFKRAGCDQNAGENYFCKVLNQGSKDTGEFLAFSFIGGGLGALSGAVPIIGGGLTAFGLGKGTKDSYDGVVEGAKANAAGDKAGACNHFWDSVIYGVATVGGAAAVAKGGLPGAETFSRYAGKFRGLATGPNPSAEISHSEAEIINGAIKNSHPGEAEFPKNPDEQPITRFSAKNENVDPQVAAKEFAEDIQGGVVLVSDAHLEDPVEGAAVGKRFKSLLDYVRNNSNNIKEIRVLGDAVDSGAGDATSRVGKIVEAYKQLSEAGGKLPNGKYKPVKGVLGNHEEFRADITLPNGTRIKGKIARDAPNREEILGNLKKYFKDKGLDYKNYISMNKNGDIIVLDPDKQAELIHSIEGLNRYGHDITIVGANESAFVKLDEGVYAAHRLLFTGPNNYRAVQGRVAPSADGPIAPGDARLIFSADEHVPLANEDGLNFISGKSLDFYGTPTLKNSKSPGFMVYNPKSLRAHFLTFDETGNIKLQTNFQQKPYLTPERPSEIPADRILNPVNGSERGRDLVNLSKRAASHPTPRLTEQQVRENWGGKNELVIPLGDLHAEEMLNPPNMAELRKIYRPDQIRKLPDGGHALVLQKGDRLLLKRYVSNLPQTVSTEILETRTITPNALQKTGYKVQDYNRRYPTLESRLSDQAQGGNSGISTSFNDPAHEIPGANPGTVSHLYTIEIPAEQIVVIRNSGFHQLRPGELNLPKHITADPENYAFYERAPGNLANDEAELIFAGQYIPSRFVTRIDVNTTGEYVPVPLHH